MKNLALKVIEPADSAQLALPEPASMTHMLRIDQMPPQSHSRDGFLVDLYQPPDTFKFEFNGVTLEILKDGTVKFSGYKKLVLSEDNADVEILGKNVKISAKHHVEFEAPRVDVNPDKFDLAYQWHKHGRKSL
jgi:hypothetical protein